MIFNAENFDIFRLGGVAVSYPPKQINTLALLVAPEKIGALSLELEGELKYGPDGEPYFTFTAERDAGDGMATTVQLTVYEDDWIVVLWNELRIFRQEDFEQTFQVDHVDYKAMQEYSEEDAKASTQIFSQVGKVENPTPDTSSNTHVISN